MSPLAHKGTRQVPKRIKLNDQVSVAIYRDGIMHFRLDGAGSVDFTGKPAAVTFRLYGELSEITPESVIALVLAQDAKRGIQCTVGDDNTGFIAGYKLAPDDLANTLATAFGVQKPKKPWWKFW
jgi:hypothetical protein